MTTKATERGPIYGVELIDSLSFDGGPMRQAMPDRRDLEAARMRSERTVAGYEVLLARYRESQEQLAECRRDLQQAHHQLDYLWEHAGSCPCGARRESPNTHRESPNTHPHVIGCPTAAAVRGEA